MFTEFRGKQIMFHVSTLLPFDGTKEQQAKVSIPFDIPDPAKASYRQRHRLIRLPDGERWPAKRQLVCVSLFSCHHRRPRLELGDRQSQLLV